MANLPQIPKGAPGYIITLVLGLLAGVWSRPTPDPAPTPPPTVPAPAPAPVEGDAGEHGDIEEVPVAIPDTVADLPSGGRVPLLVPPLAGNGTNNTPHWFDHMKGAPSTDPAVQGKQLVYTGEWIRGKQRHTAYDFVAPVGTPVKAAAAGLVVYAEDAGPVTCGDRPDADRALQVKLLHPAAPDGRDYLTAYAHLDSLAVQSGVWVKAGAVIGTSGSTGCSSGPHLHFEVRVVTNRRSLDGYAVDPFGWTGVFEDPWPYENKNLWIKTPVLYRQGQPVP